MKLSLPVNISITILKEFMNIGKAGTLCRKLSGHFREDDRCC